MDHLFWFAGQNTAVALMFALVVFGLTRLWRNPPVAHALWLLVLLKLAAPPLVRLEWPLPLPRYAAGAREPMFANVARNKDPKAASDLALTDRRAGRTTASGLTTSMPARDGAQGSGLLTNVGRRLLLGLWCGGAVIYGLVAVRRMVRFTRDVRTMLAASERVQRLSDSVAGTFGVRRLPVVLYAERVEIPLLWCGGRRPAIVLPMRLVRALDDESIALIVAHELAHLRRRDHWVRIIELIVSTVYWWNPFVRVIQRQIHEAEEMCCDAWVRWAFPERTVGYAEVLLRTAESLSPNELRAGARLVPGPASPFLRPFSLKARIVMVLESRFAPSVSRRGVLAITLFALSLVAIPSFVPATVRKARAESNQEIQPAVSPASTAHEFPHAVKFQRGATRFSKGDRITILEVRGTAETFVPGNLYWIKGTYTLGSRDRATLAAYTTARHAKDGTGPTMKVQHATINQGDGTFTLFLPMTCEGWPHVSLYPAGGGSDLGGTYFGTGDSVLKTWWGE